MKRWGKAILMVAIAITIAVGTAFAVTWQGSGDVDQLQMYAGNDIIHMGNDDDTITMGITSEGGYDCINFFDGDADLIFHGPNATPADHPVYIEYTEADEVLTVYAYTDFVVQLGN